jgi:hypothetical protein
MPSWLQKTPICRLTFDMQKTFPLFQHSVLAACLAGVLVLAGCGEKSSTPTVSATDAATAAQPVIAFTNAVPDALKGEFAFRGDCNMERFNGQAFTADAGEASLRSVPVISGWVVDAQNTAAPSAVFIRAESEDKSRVWFAPVHLTVERPDVVAARGGHEAFRRSGYDAKINVSNLPPGKYRLQLAYVTKTEHAICDNGRTIVLN